MFKSISLIFVIIFVHGVQSQIVLKGQCPKTPTINFFNSAKYSGIWYGYSKYPFESTNDLKCNYAKYNLSAPKRNVTNIGVDKSGKTVVNVWPANIVSSYNGELAIQYNKNQSLNKVNYKIIGTEYINFACAYYCEQVNRTHFSANAWLLTRKRVPAQSDVDKALATYERVNVDTQYFVKNDQTNCPNVI